MTREDIEKFPETERLKRTLKMYRNHILDYLINNEPDEHITNVLAAGDGFIKEWAENHADYLRTDDEYYSSVVHRILEPVYSILHSREGIYEELEKERDALQEERDLLAEELQRIKRDIRNYYGG